MVLHGLEEFREHLGGELTLTMLQGIGRGVEIHDVALPRMLDAISELRQRQRRAQNIAQAC
jgi:3-dehydroquinate synthase